MGARAKILAAVGTVALFTVLGVSSTLSGAAYSASRMRSSLWST